MSKLTLSPAQVKSLVGQYVTALQSESKNVVKRVRIVGKLASAQVGTQAAIAGMLSDAIGAANMAVNLDTARAQVGHAVTAYKLVQRFALIDSDTAVSAALSVSTGLIKSAVREEAFKGISSDDMTAERFVGICTALKSARKVGKDKPVKSAPAEIEAGEIENLNDDVSLVADAQAVLKQFAGILKLAQGEDADAILVLFTEFSQELLG